MINKSKKLTVLVTGNFNVLHLGHIRLINFAATIGNNVIIGVFSDKIAGTAVDVTQKLRMEAVSNLAVVSKVLPINGDLCDFILDLKPDFIVKGKEFEDLENEELVALKSYGGQLIFSSGDFTFASIEQVSHRLTIINQRKLYLTAYMERHGFSTTDVLETINSFSKQKVCVVGDLIIDEYIDCFPIGMSQEEPTLVVGANDPKRFVGGAGIVASHAAKLGADVTFLSIAGQDEVKDWASSCLKKFGVNYWLTEDASRTTNLKQRFRSEGRSLLRVSKVSQQAISLQKQKLFMERFEEILPNLNLLVFSDFNYGCLPQTLVNSLTDLAKQKGVFIAADSQSSSQIGDISRFKRADLITPTEREARIALKNFDDGLVVLANKLMTDTKSENIILKLGADGLIAQNYNKHSNLPHTERLPALSANPIDVSGAGDCVLITASMAMSMGASLWLSTMLGNLAAFIQVGRVGNVPISIKEIEEILLQ